MMNVRRERIPLLWNTLIESIGQSYVDAEMRVSRGEKVELSKSKVVCCYLIILLWMLLYSAILCPHSQAGSVCSCCLQF